MPEKTIKAILKIQLLADKVLVAESTDEKLWRSVMAAMQSGADIPDSDHPAKPAAEETPLDSVSKKGQKGLVSFAADLGLDKNLVEGACSPSNEAPFIHLERHCWESLKKNTPARGPKAIAGVNLAGTLLCLWFKHSGLEGNPTQAQAKAVLDTIDVSEKNTSRAIKNCEWLQNRGGAILLNPARVSMAKAIIKAYCTRQPVSSEG